MDFRERAVVFFFYLSFRASSSVADLNKAQIRKWTGGFLHDRFPIEQTEKSVASICASINRPECEQQQVPWNHFYHVAGCIPRTLTF